MRRYTLASSDARTDVDLREYADVITTSVQEVMPQAQVVVEKDCYYVEPTPERGQGIAIGRQICKSKLNRYCIKISKLFSGSEVEEKKEETKNGPKKKPLGGHK